MFRQDNAGWSNPKVLGILAVVFLCGLACGSAITNIYMHRASVGSNVQAIEQARRLGFQRLKEELQLTPAQVQIVSKELDDYAKYYQNIEDQRQDVAELGTQRILNVLTPDQKVRFTRMLGKSVASGAAPVSSVR